jgi:hypothetical protein
LMRSIQIAGGAKTVSRSGLLIFAAIGLLISTFVFITVWIKRSPNTEQGTPNRRI